MELKKILIEYGLKEQHAEVYLACLKTGPASIQKIGITAGCARSTCEVILKSLQNKGFVSSFKNKSIKYYSPRDPREISQDIRQTAQTFEQALPEFAALYGSVKHRPSVRVYENTKGIKIILNEILDEAREIFSVSSSEDVWNKLGQDVWPEFVKQRVKNKIPVKVLTNHSPKALERKISGINQLRQVKIISDFSTFHTLTMIWNNKIAMFSLKNDCVAVVIESQDLTDLQKALFNSLWLK